MKNKLHKQNYLVGTVKTAFILGSIVSTSVFADNYINDDLVVKGSACIGVDCASGENFNYDTIRLKENNLRIRFIDSSAAAGFPTRDWEITANESQNGGLNQFYIQNIDNATKPFIISDGAKTNNLFLSNQGYVGINTSTPGIHLHIKDGNSPTVRLEQDNSSGFTEQTWDMGGNETNFFIRDVTNSSLIPFRVRVGAPNGSIYVDGDGDIGFETITPDGIFDIAHPTDANNHAVLVSPDAKFGINIDNGFVPRGLLDVQTTGGVSRFLVQNSGNVGIGMGTADVPNGLFEAKSGGVSRILLTEDGKLGVNNSSPSSALHVVDMTASSALTVSEVTAVTVENKHANEQPRFLVKVENKGPTGIIIHDSSSNGDTWFITNDDGALTFFKDDLSTPIMKLKDGGDLEIKGTLIENAL